MKNTFTFFIISLLCVFLIYFITCAAFLPSSIILLEGEEQRFEFDLPVSVSATISSDNIAVLNVNHTSVTDNITVDLSEPITIEASEAGRLSVTMNAFGIPLKKITMDVVPSIEVIPCGLTIGVKIDTEGVMVLGTGYVNDPEGVAHKPSDGILKSGDLILNADGKALAGKDELIKIIEQSKEAVSFTVKRDGAVIETRVTPVKSAQDDRRKIGVWVRDSTQGIGTVTYYNPDTGKFGALGHGILDVDTKKLLSVKAGYIYPSVITSVKKGKKGSPGELIGDIDKSRTLGQVKLNNQYGIYGSIYMANGGFFGREKMKIAMQNEIHEGPAKILCTVQGSDAAEYDVYIEAVNRYASDDSKGMVIRITDPKLLTKTNGIVQGMSGCPIIQDGRLIGAITHVFVQDPAKGYGIFIENMLKHEGKFNLS